MAKDPKTILFQILDIIGYTDDKESFADKFIKSIYLQSFNDLFQTLPPEKQSEIQKQITEKSENPEKVIETLKGYFSETQIQEAIKNAAYEGLTQYINAIKDTLSADQKRDLGQAFQNLQVTS